MVVNFAAGQSLGEVFLFARSDHAETGNQDYRFTLTGATGGVPGGHVSTDLTIHDTDLVGDGLDNLLQGGQAVRGGLGRGWQRYDCRLGR